MSTATFITAGLVLVLPALLAGGWWLGGRPELAQVVITPEAVRIVPRGVLRVLSFRSQLLLARRMVRQAAVVTCAGLPAAGLRSPGSAVPGLRVGTYRRPEATSYWLVGRAREVVRIDLAGGPVDYVAVQVRDPGKVAALLAAGARSPAP
ncbi:MAG: hypothetical protein J2P34_11575 [Actinobacteria bacterium]|nr:hypothetical protein [Actinomycetota bacterium]